MTSQEIRQSFLDFFADRGHEVVPSSSVVPWDDPTLLFTNAGMNQFKDVFLGAGSRPYRRAVDSQKCIRAGGKHNDLEDVGKDTYHQTFFEMLGNWSFGDYYKREAILWAWELLTEVWGLPREKLWATVFREDDEAEDLWKTCTDMDRTHILRFDEKDNFWEMGDTGPCGPCSEINIDLGPERCGRKDDPGHTCGVNADCGRFMEFWNLVFIQYNRDQQGTLTTLPAKHVDTGMGFERMVAILQGVPSNYDTDVFVPLIDRIGEMTGQPYDEATTAVAFRVLADHVRALTFAITDGGLPSNEGRGYVLRRILRRAARFGRTLDQHEPFIYRLVPTVVDLMGDAYPEIRASQERVALVIKSEEEGFGRTLDRGLELFETMVARAERDQRNTITGEEAFKLYDTYGFPADLTQLMAEERGRTVDLVGFEREMEKQRSRSRAGAGTEKNKINEMTNIELLQELEIITSDTDTEFVGHETYKVHKARVMVSSGPSVVLDRTPFYAESGGQVGDTGWLITEDREKFRIVGTVKQGAVTVHLRDPEDGRALKAGTTVTACVDEDRRRATMRNHTATHLLHAALRRTLGDHVHQTGSLVAPDRLRFDFSHFSAVTKDEMDRIERRINEQVWKNIPVEWFETDLKDAKRRGAMALFGEKYGDRVRVVRIGEVSLELCGGTHLAATGEVGVFRLVRESGIASGMRRIEAVTGDGAYQTIKRDEHTLQHIAAVLKTEPDEAVRRAEALNERIRELEREIKRLSTASARNWIEDMMTGATVVDGVTVAAAAVDSPDAGTLRHMADRVRGRLSGQGVGVLCAVINDRPTCITVVTDDAISGRRLTAGSLAQAIAAIIGGGGGGKPHMAQAGGKDVEKIPEAIQQAPDIVRAQLQQSRD